MSTSTTRSVNISGGSFLTLLALLFIGLKLGGVITWSWWWVLAPLWVPWLIAILIFIGLGIALAVAKSADRRVR